MKRTGGQALVEFALVAPVFFLLLLAVLDAGRGAFASVVLANAAREATRQAATTQSDPNWQVQAAQTARAYAFGLSPESVGVTSSTQQVGTMPYVTVRVTYAYLPVVPGLKQF